MGGCCSSKIVFTVKFEGNELTLTNIVEVSMIRQRIHEEFGLTDFDIFVNSRKITSYQDISPFLHQSTHIEIIVQRIEAKAVKVEETKKELKVQRLHVTEKYKNCVYDVCNKSKAKIAECLIIKSNYTRLSSKVLTKSDINFLNQDGFFHPMKLELEASNYLICSVDSNKLNSIDEESFSDQKSRAFIMRNHKKIPLKKQEFCMYNSEEELPKDLIGQLVFDKKSEKIIGFITKVSNNSIVIDDIQEVLEEVDRNFRKSYRQKPKNSDLRSPTNSKILINSINFKTAAKEDIDKFIEVPEIYQKNDRKYAVEAGFDDAAEFQGEILIDAPNLNMLDFDQKNSFFYNGKDKLALYNPSLYSVELIDFKLKLDEGFTFTSTPDGLYVICGNKAWIISRNQENKLRNLNTPHKYHAALWHENQLFVISGEGTGSVEAYFEGQWNDKDNLPEARENPAVCSANGCIYLFGGKISSNYYDTAFRFTSFWEKLVWTSPWSYEGMGLFFDGSDFILFGGSKNEFINWKYCKIGIEGKEKSRGMMSVGECYSDKCFGTDENKFYYMINEHEVIEYSSFFKTITIY